MVRFTSNQDWPLLEFYNSIWPHSNLKALTLDQLYFNRALESLAA
ncbi:MAG: hypothetical protein ABSG60_10315 [Terracidiphilus sp.]